MYIEDKYYIVRDNLHAFSESQKLIYYIHIILKSIRLPSAKNHIQMLHMEILFHGINMHNRYQITKF